MTRPIQILGRQTWKETSARCLLPAAHQSDGMGKMGWMEVGWRWSMHLYRGVTQCKGPRKGSLDQTGHRAFADRLDRLFLRGARAMTGEFKVILTSHCPQRACMSWEHLPWSLVNPDSDSGKNDTQDTTITPVAPSLLTAPVGTSGEALDESGIPESTLSCKSSGKNIINRVQKLKQLQQPGKQTRRLLQLFCTIPLSLDFPSYLAAHLSSFSFFVLGGLLRFFSSCLLMVPLTSRAQEELLRWPGRTPLSPYRGTSLLPSWPIRTHRHGLWEIATRRLNVRHCDS